MIGRVQDQHPQVRSHWRSRPCSKRSERAYSAHLTERLVPGSICNRRAPQNFLPPLSKRDSVPKNNFLLSVEPKTNRPENYRRNHE